jgi:hypothetical protein
MHATAEPAAETHRSWAVLGMIFANVESSQGKSMRECEEIHVYGGVAERTGNIAVFRSAKNYPAVRASVIWFGSTTSMVMASSTLLDVGHGTSGQYRSIM